MVSSPESTKATQRVAFALKLVESGFLNEAGLEHDAAEV
jgi:hypothetical protein